MILDIRGTNGSGKTWIVYQLFEKYGAEPITDEQDIVIGYKLPTIPWVVMGRYTTKCGGCDTIKTAQGIEDRLYEFADKYYNVILEGLMVSHTFSRYNEIALTLGDYKFLFLTTPLKTCIKRIVARREARGVRKVPYDPWRKHAVVDDFEKVRRAKVKLTEAGRDVVDLDWKNPMPQVLELIENASSN